MNRNLPVVLYAGEPEARPSSPRRSRDRSGLALYAAQLLGQDGARRGLKGGEPVLQAARCAYLGAEWRGVGDRRPTPGVLAKTEV